MAFSSHFSLSDAAAQALTAANSNSLLPAFNALAEKYVGSGGVFDSETFGRAYGALMQFSQEGNLGESWETAFGPGLAGVVELVEAIAGQDLDQLVPADSANLDLLNPVDGVYGQLSSLVQTWGEQAEAGSWESDTLTGLAWDQLGQGEAIAQGKALISTYVAQLIGDQTLTGGGVGQAEPVSVMRLSEENNDVARQADLQVSQVAVTNAIAPGESLTVKASFQNRGNDAASPSTIRYWLSNDTVLDSADQAIGSHRLSALAPGSQTQQTVSFGHQPTWGTGTKYVLVEADGDSIVPEQSEVNNLGNASLQVAQADLQQYWFYYSFNPTNPNSADSYLGSVIAPEGTYEIAPRLVGGGYDPAYGFNPQAEPTEANTDGQYLVYGQSDYSDDLVADIGKVFVLSYTDRSGESATRVTPNQYAQGGKPSGFNFLGSESDYLGNADAATRFGLDYYEANTGNPDIDIQAYTPFGYFSTAQRSAIDTAISNWEQLILGDKDQSGVLKLAFTHSAQRVDGSDWGWVWGEAYLDQVAGQRTDRDYTTVDIGGDFHNRVNYNSAKLGQLSAHELVRLTMHEIGHALGLDEAQEDGLLGMDSLMDKHGLDPKVTEGMFQRLESLGYTVNRAAAHSLQWS